MKIGTYTIIETRLTGNLVVALANDSSEPMPWGTWIKPNNPEIKGYAAGHYFETEEEARQDFNKRE